MSSPDKNSSLRLSNEEANRFTCECLKTALFRLVGQKDFNSISVSELVKEAGVSRNSFYRNYGTMDALLGALRDDIVEKTATLLSSRGKFESRLKWYECIFVTVGQMQREFSILFGIKFSFNYLAEGIDYGSVLPLIDSDTDYKKISAAGSFIFILLHWFSNGMKESPEEMAKICVSVLPDS